MTNKVYIADVTNRDGDQTSRILLPKLSKTMLNIYLDRMGIFQSELGFPILSHEVNYINANLELVKAGGIKRLRLQGWCRALPRDIDLVFRNCPGIRHLNISLSTSDELLSAKFQGKKTWKNILNSLTESVHMAKDGGIETLGVNAEDASKAGLDRLIDLALAAKEAGANRFRYSDTLGLDEPISAYKRIKEIAGAAALPVEMHCHNDLGMAVAISLSGARGAIESGRDAFIDTTVNGYGERAGNCDLVSTLLAMKYSPAVRETISLDEHIDLSMAWKISQYASYAFNIPVPLNQPGVGSNMFAHESGIHASGMLRDRESYELYPPEALGRGKPCLIETGRVITTGAYGGMSGFRHIFEGLGISFNGDTEARTILKLVQLANLNTLKPLTDDELRFIAGYPDIAARLLTVNAE
jgi:homocitrate synthase NifV